MKVMVTSKKRVEFAICLANEEYDDLEVWKVYQVLSDPKAAGVGCIRVIDESGEDYLYPADRFVGVDLASLSELATRCKTLRRDYVVVVRARVVVSAETSEEMSAARIRPPLLTPCNSCLQ